MSAIPDSIKNLKEWIEWLCKSEADEVKKQRRINLGRRSTDFSLETARNRQEQIDEEISEIDHLTEIIHELKTSNKKQANE